MSSAFGVRNRPLIIGSADDEHVQAVLAAIGDGANPLLVDTERLEDTPFTLTADRFELGDEAIELGRSRAWLRRLSPPRWRMGTVSGSRDAAVRASFVSVIVALGSHPGVDWLTPYPGIIAAENKLRQYAHADRLGIRTPRTIVTSDAASVPRDLGNKLVAKPFGPGHFVADDGEARVVWAQTLDRDDERLRTLAAAPFLLQERVEAREHLRVVTCKGKSWVGVLDAEGLPLDWRRNDDAHHAFASGADEHVQRAAERLARDLGVGYSSQDWIRDGRDAVFIDLNPAGQWLFLPAAVRDAVTAAVAAHLLGS